MSNKLHLLAICSKNKQRSPTAAAIYRQDARVEVRSAGTSPQAVHMVSLKDVEWAGLIVCMEQKHQAQLRRLFPSADLAKVKILDIPDEYTLMDPDLIEMLKTAIEPLIEAAW